MDTKYLIRYIKHILKKAVRKPDPTWSFYNFEHTIHSKTLSRHQEILSWAEQSLIRKDEFEVKDKYEQSNDPIVRQGYKLKEEVKAKFHNKYSNTSDVRILIQVPDPLTSPAHFSFYSNLIESLNFIGIQTQTLSCNDDTTEILEQFRPTIFLSTDHTAYLDKIDWQAMGKYREKYTLHIGLNARLEEEEIGNSPLLPRLDWAKKHGVEFYFSFRDKDYINKRTEYKPFHEYGYPILLLPFGANPLHHYPIPDIERDIDYCFLSSAHWTKGLSYSRLAKKTVSHYPGFINGIGWKHVKEFLFDRDRDRYIYARSKVGFNFHIPEQIEYACEVNERTHHLAMCGLPQIIDTPKLLPKLYSTNSLFMCQTGDEFMKHFKEIIANPMYGQQRALLAQKEVFNRHTSFHCADNFITQLQDSILKN